MALVPSIASGFCDTQVVHDYTRVLRKMPPLRGVPANHDLPFGPSGLYLFKGNRAPVMVPIGAPGGVGFAITNKRGGSNQPVVHIDWLETIKLTEVDKSGSPLRLLEWRSRRVTRAPGAGLWVDFAGAPGFYRLDFVIRNRKGRVLGKFGEYFRVLAAKTNGRISLDAPSYQPGQSVSACLENFGTTTLSSGAARTIEVFDGSAWSRSPIDPPTSVAFQIPFLGPGEAVPVGSFPLPSDAPDGRYRWTWRGSVANAPLQISSEFSISAAP
jgi:hypothetical protein